MEKVIVGIVLTGIVLVFIAVGATVQSTACAWRWEGYQTKYSLFTTDCKVLIDGKYIPEKNVRIGN